MRRSKFRSSSGIIAMLIIFPIFFFSLSYASAVKEIVIGGSVPLSGDTAETGRNVYNGYKAAVKMINENYGGVKVGGELYKLKLTMFDDASDPIRATTLIQQQIDEGVDFFLGSFSSKIVLPTCSITERAKKPMVQAGGGSDTIFTQGRKFVFGIYPRASRQFDTILNFFKTQSDIKTVTIVHTNRPFTKWIANSAKKTLEDSDYTVFANHKLPANVKDVSSVLSSVRTNPPDVLLLMTHDESSMLIVKQMVTTNTYVKILYVTMGPPLPSFRETLGKYTNGIIAPVFWDENVPHKGTVIGSAKEFSEFYNKNFKRKMAFHTATGAACIVAYVHAIENANSLDPVKVRDALDNLDVMSFYGRLKFTPDGDAEAESAGPVVAQVQNEELEFIFPEAAKTAKFQYPMTPWNKRK